MTTPVRRILPRKTLEADVYTLACERTATIMDRFDKVFVSFSGGKDSTATLNVALDVAHSDPRYERHLPMRAVFFDEEAIPFETEDYVRRMGQRDDITLDWMCLPVQHRNACSRRHPYWWPWAPEAEDRWCRPLPPEAIQTWPGFPLWPDKARYTIPDTNGLLADPQDGNTAMLMGIRAAESLTRNQAVSQKTIDNYVIKYTGATDQGCLWKVYPVYDWTDTDVWTAPALLHWDYNLAYDRQEMAGRTIHQQRCSPAFGEEPLQQLHTWAQCFPEVWDKMVDRVPGAAAAARYALTELYGFTGRPDKPAGMTWPDFVLWYLGKHPPDIAAQVATRIKDKLRRHYKQVSLPIAPDTPCPETGLSWNWLLGIAMRGDFKGRKHEKHRIVLEPDGTRPVTAWRRYLAELQALKDAGLLDEIACPFRLPADLTTLLPDYAREAAE